MESDRELVPRNCPPVTTTNGVSSDIAEQLKPSHWSPWFKVGEWGLMVYEVPTFRKWDSRLASKLYKNKKNVQTTKSVACLEMCRLTSSVPLNMIYLGRLHYKRTLTDRFFFFSDFLPPSCTDMAAGDHWIKEIDDRSIHPTTEGLPRPCTDWTAIHWIKLFLRRRRHTEVNALLPKQCNEDSCERKMKQKGVSGYERNEETARKWPKLSKVWKCFELKLKQNAERCVDC